VSNKPLIKSDAERLTFSTKSSAVSTVTDARLAGLGCASLGEFAPRIRGPRKVPENLTPKVMIALQKISEISQIYQSSEFMLLASIISVHHEARFCFVTKW
jgi:hypothetical protein